MKSQKLNSIRHKRTFIAMVMFISVIMCFTQTVLIKDKVTPDEYPEGLTNRFFNDDGGVNFCPLDTVYQANMTFLLGKKTLHPYIIVDIDKANLSYNITEKELIKSPYCYLTIATSGVFFLENMSYPGPIPIGGIRNDAKIIYDGYMDFFEWVHTKRWWMYERIGFWDKDDLKKSPYKNFYVAPFNPPTNKAVLCMMKAKFISRFTGIIMFVDYVSKDPSKPLTSVPDDERIAPYKFDNPEVFYKVLFPYADK